MSDQFHEIHSENKHNIIKFPPLITEPASKRQKEKPLPPTPIYDELIAEAAKFNKLSKYRCEFDYTVYRDLELRYKERPIRGGIVKSNPIKLVNSHATCQQCLYAFEIDTYGRGCTHNCTYCYAKAELTVHGYWNNPIPVPVDLNQIRKIFYTVFETKKPSKWRSIMERKIPLRVGCMSDSFMWVDTKYKVTQEFLKLLNFYRYPYTIITHSDLVGRDDYMALLKKDLCSVQFSIPSTNDNLNRQLEPGAPSAKRRLLAARALSNAGFTTAVRINPMFPIYPDGYFTNPHFKWDGPPPKLEYSSFEMVDEIADTGCKAIIAGFGRFSSFSINNMTRATGIDFRQFFNKADVNKSKRDYHFSEKEIRHYYEELKRRCNSRSVEFTVCYIGNGESQFWEHQDLWSNKTDCCNIKGKVQAFKTDSREISFEQRLKFSTKQTAIPIDPQRLHVPLGEQSEQRITNPTSNAAKIGPLVQLEPPV